ncbi:arylamine N-acetyltransferase family protein [Streptomyces sp. NBC_00370]|uniref:arylamine N-acetyltransferase family protein n=1 Tax=Streptomyces sp. NBC_00370 TaxID=2975728 RepID=UPI002E26E94A
MNPELVDGYLQRIGAKRPERADAAALKYLQERHVLSIPFENISFHLNEPVPHSLEAVEKIIRERRGGCCELHSAFALLLRALGFQVTFLAGRVYRGKKPSGHTGHFALLVEIEEGLRDPGGADTGVWLVDVAQGGNSRWPLRFDARSPQDDPHGTYLLSDAPEGDVDVSLNGVPLYRLETRPRELEFFFPVLWWYRTAPDSPFVNRILCVQPREDGRVALTATGRVLIREQNGGETIRQKITGEEELREVLRTWFGIDVDHFPKLPGATARTS